MVYDTDLADRIRDLLEPERGLTEKKMFGGLAFMIDGNMTVSVSGRGGLMLRVNPQDLTEHLQEPHADTFEMRGRVMSGWLRVEPAGVQTDEDLERWVAVGVDFARSLGPKRPTRKRA